MYMWIKNIFQILQHGISFLHYFTFPTPRRGAEGTIGCKKQSPCSKTRAQEHRFMNKILHITKANCRASVIIFFFKKENHIRI